ncbi:hypothetical protein Hamer_G031644 [Homarus americanus]|uniref:Uncharacterized protein n=1 Tax=Homarus americanus TaxID=6706 RepID=A0A8J5NBN4_HOMAM|nr:hypothetical protein Hamer_G019523 [Homarus americanus]KAG7176471.1 hypothetical protein Hamer_G031644 [Homarus americanus]
MIENNVAEDKRPMPAGWGTDSRGGGLGSSGRREPSRSGGIFCLSSFVSGVTSACRRYTRSPSGCRPVGVDGNGSCSSNGRDYRQRPMDRKFVLWGCEVYICPSLRVARPLAIVSFLALDGSRLGARR